MTAVVPDYLNPNLPDGLAHFKIPIVEATAESVKGYGWLVDDPANCKIEIIRWPAQGSRPVDTDSGDEGGTTEGIFSSEWKGDILYGSNEAVGGQMFFPLENEPFLVPVALPGDDISPEKFICFLCNGSQGLYIHANVWHEGVFAISGKRRFLDRQGAVHARVSVDFAREFNCLLEIPLTELF